MILKIVVLFCIGLSPKCTVSSFILQNCGVFMKRTPITISPAALENEVVENIKLPNFLQNEDLQFKINQLSWETMNNTEILKLKRNNQVIQILVASDELLSTIDYRSASETPAKLDILLKSKGKQCVVPFLLQLYDDYFVYEPEWEANPPLQTEYVFTLNCPDSFAPIGTVGEYHSEIGSSFEESIEYHLVTNSEYSNILEKVEIDKSTGRLFLRVLDNPDHLYNTMHEFQVSASLEGENTLTTEVLVKFGNCSVIENEKERSQIANSLQYDEPLQLYFKVDRCIQQGDLVGNIPTAVLDPKSDSLKLILKFYVVPADSIISTTSDGSLRLLVEKLPLDLYSVTITGATSDNTILVWNTTIEVSECNMVETELSEWLTTDASCKNAGEAITTLNDVPQFLRYIDTRGKMYLGTSRKDLFYVSQTNDQYEIRLKRIPKDNNVKLVIYDAEIQVELGYITINFANAKDCQVNPSSSPQTIIVRNPYIGKKIGYIPSILPTGQYQYYACCSQFYYVEPFTGIIYVQKAFNTFQASTEWLQVEMRPRFQQPAAAFYRTILEILYLPSFNIFNDGGDASCEEYSMQDEDVRLGVVLEDAPVGSVVGQVFRKDASNETVQWNLERTNGYEIDSARGIIRTTNPISELSREIQAFAKTNKGPECIIKFRPYFSKTIVDANVNKQPPRFSQSSIVSNLKLGCKSGRAKLFAGMVIGEVKAVDSDQGDAGKIVYSLCDIGHCDTRLKTWENFAIEPTTGVIYVINDHSYEEFDEVGFLVYASNEAMQGDVIGVPNHVGDNMEVSVQLECV